MALHVFPLNSERRNGDNLSADEGFLYGLSGWDKKARYALSLLFIEFELRVCTDWV